MFKWVFRSLKENSGEKNNFMKNCYSDLSFNLRLLITQIRQQIFILLTIFNVFIKVNGDYFTTQVHVARTWTVRVLFKNYLQHTHTHANLSVLTLRGNLLKLSCTVMF